MKKNAVAMKIERIMRRIADNTFVDNDILVLLVTLRELEKASIHIFEIGCFVAHSNIRDKGIIKDILFRNYCIFKLHYGRDKELIRSRTSKLPYYLPKLIQLQCKAIGNEALSAKLQVSITKLVQMIKTICSEKTLKVEGDYCYLQRELDELENRLVSNCLSHLYTFGGISLDELINQMRQLISIENSGIDTQPLEDRKREIFCAIACLMHNVDYVISTKEKVNAKTIIDFPKAVEVCGVFNFEVYNDKFEKEKEINIMFSVLQSNFSIEEIFCDNVTHDDIKEGNLFYISQVGKIGNS
jgi:hypothetical protein